MDDGIIINGNLNGNPIEEIQVSVSQQGENIGVIEITNVHIIAPGVHEDLCQKASDALRNKLCGTPFFGEGLADIVPDVQSCLNEDTGVSIDAILVDWE